MPKKVRISLANKCQLLFGGAVVLILGAALAVGWLRMRTLVIEGHEETARRLANAWLADLILIPEAVEAVRPVAQSIDPGLQIWLIRKSDVAAEAERDAFLASALRRFTTRPDQAELFREVRSEEGEVFFRYARAIRKSDLSRIRGQATAGDAAREPPRLEGSVTADPLEMILQVQMRADLAGKQLMLNRIYILAAGLLAGLLAIGAFWYITTRIILSPVRVLKDVAEKVSDGDLNIRSDINTGDEFEQLSDMFNTMLANLKSNQDELRGMNKSLDLKLGELAETNVSLYEANKIKGEFLANVSHELRTPLHSMIGFAEVLDDTLEGRTGPVDEKRKRYVANIISSSRRLLDLINDLLDLAKIEAGRMDLSISPMSVADTAEGLINLIRPQANKRHIELRLKVERNIPMVQTDAGKFQQIIFNFLSNAVKFSPEGGTIELKVEHVPPLAGPGTGQGQGTGPGGPGAPGQSAQLRTSVSDDGRGIPPEKHEQIFEKFTQLDQTVTREHVGTGLGLTISRDLAKLLQGTIEVDSDHNRGATFTLTIPMVLETRTTPLMPEEPLAAGANPGEDAAG